jgi:hypothetical protein
MDKELLDFENFEIKGSPGKNRDFLISNYNSIDLSEISYYLMGISDKWITHLKIHDNSKIEKIVYDYYGNDKYYDLILFLNKREMLFDMPYSNDIILDAIERDITEYEFKVFGGIGTKLGKQARQKLIDKLDSQYTENNQKFSFLKVIKPEYIETVGRKIRDILKTQKDMFALGE